MIMNMMNVSATFVMMLMMSDSATIMFMMIVMKERAPLPPSLLSAAHLIRPGLLEALAPLEKPHVSERANPFLISRQHQTENTPRPMPALTQGREGERGGGREEGRDAEKEGWVTEQ